MPGCGGQPKEYASIVPSQSRVGRTVICECGATTAEECEEHTKREWDWLDVLHKTKLETAIKVQNSIRHELYGARPDAWNDEFIAALDPKILAGISEDDPISDVDDKDGPQV